MGENKQNKQNRKGVADGFLFAYSILVAHALLIGLLFIIVIFFRGIVRYMLWIVIGGILLTFISGYFFYQRLKKNSGNIKDILNDPMFRGRNLEISLLGGMASLKFSTLDPRNELTYNPTDVKPLQLEDPKVMRIKDLERLAKLFENKLITEEEYQRLKQELLG